jgi:hypothetical protein
VAAYGFDERSGGTAVDGSGNGNTGTIHGAKRTSYGKHGKALSFDGNDDVSAVDSSSLRLTAGMTLEAWVKPSVSSSVPRHAIAKVRPAGGFDYALAGSDGQGKASGMVRTSGEYSTQAGALTAGRWSHLAATYDGSVVRVYIDGVLASSRSVTGAIATTGGVLKIGGVFKGVIDDVRVWDAARSASAIQADSSAGVTASAVASRVGASAKRDRHRSRRHARKPAHRHKSGTKAMRRHS